MNAIPIYQVDAFTSKLFQGNPAAICPLSSWLPDETMQLIAAENNLAETAFLVGAKNNFQIRWFTPAIEVALCGHATLASAHVIFTLLAPETNRIEFQSKSGPLIVTKNEEVLTMDFPADTISSAPPPPGLIEAVGIDHQEVYKGKTDYMIIAAHQSVIEKAKPDFNLLSAVNARGIIITAPGEQVDFVSRFFAPASGINEDPVTGSAHCSLTPYWAARLGKTQLEAWQVSPRKGYLKCQLQGDRVKLSGQAVTYMSGEIFI